MVNAGRVLIIGKGEWNALSDYQQLDMVSYDNKAYLARQASVGVNPSTDVSMTYWQPFGSAAEPDQETIIKNSEGELAVNIDGDTIVFDQEAGKLKATLGVSALKDITILNPSNNQVLRYNSTTRKWENKSLGSAADKSSTNELSQGNQGLIESGAVFDEFQNVYKVNDQAITSVASDDLMPIYDTSANGKKKIAVSNFIGGLVSNPNLLDNPWFTVNQRGFSSKNDNGFTVDRWQILQAAGTVSLSNGAITIDPTVSGTTFLWGQTIEDALTRFAGKTLTLSILLSDGTIKSKAFEYPISVSSNRQIMNVNLGSTHYFEIYAYTSGHARCGYYNNAGTIPSSPLTIKAVKLELGSVSTLAMDTEPNYTTELLKCQRYFVRVGGSTRGLAFPGWILNKNARGCIDLSVPMRTKPIFSGNAGTWISSGHGIVISTASNITVDASYDNKHITLCEANIFPSSIVDELCILRPNINEYFELAADL